MKEKGIRDRDRTYLPERIASARRGATAPGAQRAVRHGANQDSKDGAEQAIAALVGNRKRVLELAAGESLSRPLRGQGCDVITVGIDEGAIDGERTLWLRLGDDYVTESNETVAERTFDIIIAASTLEYLKYPAIVLRGLKRFLKPGGYIVASIPNVAYLNTQLALLSGKNTCATNGPPRRLFTRDSFENLLVEAGFAIGPVQRIEKKRGEILDFPAHETIAPALIEALSHDPEASTYKFVVVAHPLPFGDGVGMRVAENPLANGVPRRGGAMPGQSRPARSLGEFEADGCIIALREEAAHKDGRIAELSAQIAAADAKTGELSQEIEDQQRRVIGMAAKIEVMSVRERDLREMLLDAHDQLLKRDEEMTVALAASLAKKPAPNPAPQPMHGKFLPYQLLIHQIRELVRTGLPASGKVLVVSKGDPDLLKLEPCEGLHFPQTEDGKYAGHHPSDDASAIAELKRLLQGGARYFLIPQTSFWWLEHYKGLSEYLSGFSRVIDHTEVCVVFDLMSAKQHGADGVSKLSTNLPFGINLAGHLRSEKGVGEGVRSTLRSLKAAEIPTALNDFTDVTSLNLDAECSDFSANNPYSINLIHANADCLSDFFRWKTRTYFEGRYSIGYWAWELSRFPKDWSSSFSLVDEVWVPSTFVLDSVSRVSPVPVVAIPHSMSELTIPKNRGRSFFGLPEDRVLFLFMFDFMSILERKNPLGLFEAFRKAFKPRDKTTLVLKVTHAESQPREFRKFEEAAKGLNVKIIKGVLSRIEINGLLNACDCYVSLHRSEGFGLTMAEAMSLGKPVIATGYSGNMDFMSPTNSFLVNHKLVKLEQDYPPYQKGAMWAEPDNDHAAELMRKVVGDRRLARDRGRQAQKDIREKFGAESVGRMVRDRLVALAEMGKIAAPAAFLTPSGPKAPDRQASPGYLRLVRRLRKLVLSCTPAGSNVLVVSKGDDQLLSLSARKGWHFPQQDDGAYAGFYPSDSRAAIRHLEALREKGAQYLLIPETAFWWLDYYGDFKKHLDGAYRTVATEDSGILYALTAKSARAKAATVHRRKPSKPRRMSRPRPPHNP